MYRLTGNERIEESTDKVECGEVVTTKYFNGDELVRVDKAVNVDPKFMSEAFSRL
jgi:hypothetical protein